MAALVNTMYANNTNRLRSRDRATICSHDLIIHLTKPKREAITYYNLEGCLCCP